MKRKAVKSISHDELSRAIEGFKARGGLIKVLPAEIEPARNLVGARYAEFETITSTTVPESRGSPDSGGAAA